MDSRRCKVSAWIRGSRGSYGGNGRRRGRQRRSSDLWSTSVARSRGGCIIRRIGARVALAVLVFAFAFELAGVQKAFRHAGSSLHSVCTDPCAHELAPAHAALAQLANLLVGKRIVVVQSRLSVTVPRGAACNEAKRCMGGFYMVSACPRLGSGVEDEWSTVAHWQSLPCGGQRESASGPACPRWRHHQSFAGQCSCA